MRSRETATICANLQETGAACMDLMQVNQALLDECALTPIALPTDFYAPKSDVAPIEQEDGLTVNVYLPSVIAGLEAYDQALVPGGVAVFASTKARSVWYSSSPEISSTGPVNPEKARLTLEFLRSVNSLNVLGRVDLKHHPVHEKEIAAKTKRLAQTLIAVTVANPDKIYLPGDRFIDENAADVLSVFPVQTYTRSQAEGLGRLSSFWQARSMKKYAVQAETITEGADKLPEIDTDAWIIQLRREQLGIWTPQERKNFIDFLSSATQHAYERAIEAGAKPQDFLIADLPC